MRKILLLAVTIFFCSNIFSQDVYWVFFTDKANTTFDPYSYFDSKAIERRLQNHISLYDSSDFPLNAQYCESVAQHSEEVVGASRWLNAMAVVATPKAMEAIQRLPFVKNTVPIRSDMTLCSRKVTAETKESGIAEAEKMLSAATDATISSAADAILSATTDATISLATDPIRSLATDPNILHAQLKRMGGEEFVKAGTRGKGIRIAVLDGGFPLVDKHAAFQHLRDNNQILKTYNFPKKCENVYGWNSHGTMTLSCISGLDVLNGCAIGLATEAEFLLARTEVGSEPLKEEVWWVMGVEWADKNGAQIISSSLGYGNINHWTSETDGTSPISKAANMAVEKGILICNSAGNEGTNKSWPGIILPADAENVLTVGGINPTNDNHQDFASYGPTADGRLKPNVSAYASECRVASPSGTKKYSWVAGTSFSCPLVAGFAACAWQSHPEYTALQLKAEIEKSGDVYPYYDYAIGYGVPQAMRFTNPSLQHPEKSFDITQEGRSVYITPHNYALGDALYYHIRRADGRLYTYRHVRFDFAFTGKVEIEITSFGLTDTLCVWYNGYSEDLALTNTPQSPIMKSRLVNEGSHEYNWLENYTMGGRYDNPPTWGNHAKNKFGFYLSYGMLFASPTTTREYVSYPYSDAWHIGLYYLRNVTKKYGWGISLEEGTRNCNIDKNIIQSYMPGYASTFELKKATLHANQLDLEFYQHFRLSSGYNGTGCALEIGLFGSWIHPTDLNCTFNTNGKPDGTPANNIYKYSKTNKWDYGMTLRVNYSALTLFAKVHSGALFGSTIETTDVTNIFNRIVRLSNDRNMEFGVMLKF